MSEHIDQSAEAPARMATRQVSRFLIQRNPFYLFSAALVIHGSGRWYEAGGSHSPWDLMLLLGSFTVVLAIVGVLIVRLGKVWDDARTIFVVLQLIFVELALSFDETLAADPAKGCQLLLFGWVFAVVVSEGVFIGLRIRLGARIRIPFHLMTALLFLYPLTMSVSIADRAHDLIKWQLFAYFLCAAVCVLSLLPAVRGGRAYSDNNGTPWRWPMFPWTSIVVLFVGVLVRGFASCASLDPALGISVVEARKLPSIFNLYFLSPVIIAIAVLVLEAGLMRKRVVLQQVAFWLCGAACALALPIFQQTTLQENFTRQLCDASMSPLFTSVALTFVVVVMAMCRGVQFAPRWLAVLGVLLAYARVDSATFEWEPTVGVLAGVGVLLGIYSAFARSLVWWNVAMVFVAIEGHLQCDDIFGQHLWVIEFCAVLSYCLLIGLALKNRPMQYIASALICVGAMALGRNLIPVFLPTDESRIALLLALFLVTALAAWKLKASPLWPGAAVTAICLTGLVVKRILQAQGGYGLLVYCSGVAFLGLAIAVSWKKSRQPEAG